MSIIALNWAIAQRLKPTPKLVLLVLAHRHHQQTRQCNPSLARLMADTGLSRSAIKTALRSLVALRLIRIRNRKRGAYDLSNQHELLLDNAAGETAKDVAQKPKRGQQPAASRGSQPAGASDNPEGPGAGLNREGEKGKGPSQKNKGKRTQEKTSPRETRTCGDDGTAVDDPFGEGA